MTQRKSLWLVLFVLFACLLPVQSGCSYPKAVRTYEFVVQYDRMTDRFEPLVSLLYIPDEATFSAYKDLIVGNVTVGGVSVSDQTGAERYAVLFRSLLQKEVRKTRCFRLVTLDQAYDDGDPALRLEAKITRFDYGSGFCRFVGWSAYWLQGEAASDFQVEGRITDAATGCLLMEFVDRRRHMGNTPWGPTFRTFNDEFVMKETLKDTALCLSKVIQMAANGTPLE